MDRLKDLTAREREVLLLLLQGKSTKEAAKQLAVSPRTVEAHRYNVYGKTGAKSLIDLFGLFDPGDKESLSLIYQSLDEIQNDLTQAQRSLHGLRRIVRAIARQAD